MRFPTEGGRAYKASFCGVLAALGLIFSYIEFLIPLPLAIPGIKLGLANIVVIVALYSLGEKYAFLVNITRIILAAALFGSVFSGLYALAGGLLSFACMALLKKAGVFSVAGVSMAGGVFHNAGQLTIAALVVGSAKVIYYFPLLTLSGMATGIGVGVLAHFILKRLKV